MSNEEMITMTKEEMISKDPIVREVVDKVYGLKNEITDEDLVGVKTGYKSVQKFSKLFD